MLTATVQDLRLYLYVTFFASAIIAVTCGVLLTTYETSFRVTITTSIITALLTLTAVPLFLLGLKAFKSELRRAYIILCVGIAVFGIAQLQIPIINIFGYEDWLNSGGAAIVYIISVVPMLLAMRKFAKILGIKSIWSSFSLCIGLAIVASVLVSFLPHIPVASPELTYDLFQGIIIWNMFFVGFAGMLTLQIRQYISSSYKPALAWLASAFLCVVVAGLHFLILRMFFTDGDWYYSYSFSIIPFGVGAALFAIAGYKFDCISAIDTQKLQSQASELTIITYIASLVSKPDDIEEIVDDIRKVSSQLKPGESLSSDQKRLLAQVFMELEIYLTTKEALRLYTQQSLHDELVAKFGEENINKAGFKQLG